MSLRDDVIELVGKGWNKQAIADHLSVHRSKVRRLLEKEATAAPARPEDSRTVVEHGDMKEIALKVPRFIESEADAIAASGVDQTEWEKDRLELRYYPLPMGDGKITQGTYIKIAFKRRAILDVKVAVAAMVESAIAQRGYAAPYGITPASDSALLDVLVVADPHFGKYAWSGSTGHDDYDLAIAETLTWRCADYLLRTAPRSRERLVVFLGDVFHYDTPGGATTGGTVLDRDSRHHKMLHVGTGVCARIVRASAQTALTRVLVVPGNHDEILSAALHCVLSAEFRMDERVTIHPGATKRQYLEWGGNLLGFDHGDKSKKSLPKAMQTEQREAWGRTQYAEWHTGHLHQEMTLTDGPVVVRTHRSVTPPDQWHADNTFIGAARGMQAYTYHVRGGVVSSRTADTYVLEAA